jgi:hypothetical protein
MVDFQGVCLQRQLRLEKSSGGLFRGVSRKQTFIKSNFFRFQILQTISILIWNFINHIAMYEKVFFLILIFFLSKGSRS